MITVDSGTAVPPYEQIRSQLNDRIRAGELAAGSRLPSIRQLAGDLRVAAGTVARAYGQLEAAGLIESSRTHGTRVRPDQSLDDDIRRAAARFVGVARRSSTDLGDALGLIRAEWAHRADSSGG
ncbi:MAG: GntR family transcriptional regulator [Propionibacteriaceae bacterium]